ncbi:hypothetical protein ACJX0J_023734, partial [Zea mays]
MRPEKDHLQDHPYSIIGSIETISIALHTKFVGEVFLGGLQNLMSTLICPYRKILSIRKYLSSERTYRFHFHHFLFIQTSSRIAYYSTHTFFVNLKQHTYPESMLYFCRDDELAVFGLSQG